MKEIWYFVSTPPRIDKLQPGESLSSGSGYPSFRKARMALIEDLQRDARIYRGWAEDKLKLVVEVAHMEEPS